MKIRLLTISLSAALLGAGCGKKDTASATPPSAAAPSASTAATSAPAAATTAATPAAAPAPAASTATAGAARTIEITANDQMKFNVATLEAKAGEQLKVVFKNLGTLPKDTMGHNWVLLKKGSDPMVFGTSAMGAKATDFIPENNKSQVIAHTKLLGPKQEDTITFTVPSEAGDYPFLCSFPGHFAIMKGVLTVK